MVFVVISALVWFIYGALTSHGAFQFPAYTTRDKVKSLFLIWCIPFVGAYLVNRNMGHRIDEAAKVDLWYELPWWASIGLRVIQSEIDD